MNSAEKEKIQKCLEIIALSEGITVDEVKKEIALTISYALKSKDPKAQAFWKSVPCDGDSPTVEEIINYLAIQLSTIKN